MTTQWRNVKGNHANPSHSRFHISKVIGGILLFMLCTMLVLTCATYILVGLYGKAQPPIMEIIALSVSGLNVSRASLEAKWDVILNVQNPNLISTLHVDRMEGMVVYQEEVVAESSLKAIVLGPKEQRMVRFRVWRNADGYHPVVKEWIVTKLNEDKKGEEIDFSVHMGVWGKIKCGWWWTKRVIMNPRCEDLSIELVPGRGFGMLLHDGPIECSVPMLDS